MTWALVDKARPLSEAYSHVVPQVMFLNSGIIVEILAEIF